MVLSKNFIVIKGNPNTGKTTLAKDLLNIFPNSWLIETDWELATLLKKKTIKIPEQYKKYWGKALGQIEGQLSDREKDILYNRLKSEIETKLQSFDTVITEGFTWTKELYQSLFNEYENIFIIDSIGNYLFIVKCKQYAIKFDNKTENIEKIKKFIRDSAINEVKPIFGRYQEFDFLGYRTDSNTLAKLEALNLPEDMTDETVLDIGCNNGFFSIECDKRGASCIGIDHDEKGIHVANIIKNSIYFCNDTKFMTLKIEDLLKEFKENQFSLILALSVLHYCPYIAKVIRDFFYLTKKGGTLKLEMGIHPGDSPEIYHYNVNGTHKYYPTFSKMQEMLNGHEYEICNSVNQAGDGFNRYVFTVHV